MHQTQQPAATDGASQQPTLDSEARREVLTQRDRLIDLQNQSSQSMDKLVVTLSGGALALSLTFIRQTVPAALPGTTPYLGAAWIILTLSLFAQLLSHFTSQYGMMKICDEIESKYLNVLQTEKKARRRPGQAYQWISKKLSSFSAHRMTTHYLNIAAIFLCVAGVALLVVFVMLNFPQLQIPLQK
jgi:hypothetical protein